MGDAAGEPADAFHLLRLQELLLQPLTLRYVSHGTEHADRLTLRVVERPAFAQQPALTAIGQHNAMLVFEGRSVLNGLLNRRPDNLLVCRRHQAAIDLLNACRDARL